MKFGFGYEDSKSQSFVIAQIAAASFCNGVYLVCSLCSGGTKDIVNSGIQAPK